MILRYNPDGGLNRQANGAGTETLGYQGYALTVGRFLSTTTQDYAVSVPRRNNYRGSVSDKLDMCASRMHVCVRVCTL